MSSLNRSADFPVLKTKRCNLDSIVTSDLNEVLLLLRDDDVIMNIEASSFYNSNIDSIIEFIDIFHNAFANNRAILWGVKLKELPKQLIGMIATYDIQQNGKANVFYALNKQYRRRGIMTECLREVSKYCFNTLKLKQIILKINRDNTQSLLLATRCNYKEIECVDNIITVILKP